MLMLPLSAKVLNPPAVAIASSTRRSRVSGIRALFLTAPDVTVIVVEMNSQFVSVIGSVAHNARISLTRDLRVLEAIATAGGFTTFADKDNIRIVRRGEGGAEVEYRFDYDAYIKGKAPGTNIVLRNGDTIIVPE